MGTVHQIHPGLIETYHRVRDHALYAATEEYVTERDLGTLMRAREDHGAPAPHMTIRERAWHEGTAVVLDALIEVRTKSAPGPQTGET